MKRKVITTITSFALSSAMILSLSGCGNTSSAQVNSQAGNSTAKSVSDGKTEVKFWYSGGKTAVNVVENIVTEFNASQDKYLVTTVTQADYDETYQKLQAAIAGDAAPDVVLLDTDKTRSLYQKDLIEPLDTYLKNSSDFNKDDYISVFFDQGTYDDGTIYAIPAYGTTQVLYYNVEAFNKAGVEPSSIKTWQDLAGAAKKVKDARYDAGWEPMWGQDNLIDAAFSNGAKVFSDDGKTVTINSKEWVDVWESFRKWIHDDKTMTIHSGGQGWQYWYDTMDDVLQNKAGGYTGSSGDQADLDFSVVQAMEQPAWASDSQSAPMAEALLLAALKTSSDEKIEGAYEFMRYFTSPSAQAEWTMATGYVPVNKKVSEDPDYKAYVEKNPQASVPLAQADHGSVYPVDPTNGAVIDALKTAADKVEIDGISAKEALDEAQKTAQAALDDALGSN